MSLSIKYETLEEADRRLRNTVVLYDNEPVYISAVEPSPEGAADDIYRVYACPLPLTQGNLNQAAFRKYISSGKFDFAPFKMGFLNLPEGVFFMERIPQRAGYKQGLSQNGYTIYSLGSGDIPTPAFASMISDPAFVAMIKGQYPCLKDTMEQLRSKKKECLATMRNLAISHEDDLELSIAHYKRKRVGIITDDDRLKLSTKFRFLQEEMEENKIPLA